MSVEYIDVKSHLYCMILKHMKPLIGKEIMYCKIRDITQKFVNSELKDSIVVFTCINCVRIMSDY